MKQTWIYVQIALILLYIICFTILLADKSVMGGQEEDAFFAVLGVNWILLFLVVGLLSKNSVPLGIFFTVITLLCDQLLCNANKIICRFWVWP